MSIDLGTIKDWTGVIGALGGAIVGAVIAFIVSSRQQSHQRKLEIEKRLIEKYEEIHMLLSQTSSEGAFCAAALLHHYATNVPLEPEEVSGEVSIDRLRMLVDFYASPLRTEVEALSKAWVQLFRITAQVFAAAEQSSQQASNAHEIVPSLAQELSNQCAAAQRKITTLAAGLQR